MYQLKVTKSNWTDWLACISVNHLGSVLIRCWVGQMPKPFVLCVCLCTRLSFSLCHQRTKKHRKCIFAVDEWKGQCPLFSVNNDYVNVHSLPLCFLFFLHIDCTWWKKLEADFLVKQKQNIFIFIPFLLISSKQQTQNRVNVFNQKAKSIDICIQIIIKALYLLIKCVLQRPIKI